MSVAEGRALLDSNTERLLGPPPANRSTRIMVTLPSEAASRPELVASLAVCGMDLARVNCAHDDEPTWAAMISHVRSLADGSSKRVAMDLGGPKLRTATFEPGPQVVRIAPTRDRLGRVVSPASVLLVADDASNATDAGATVIPVTDPSWLSRRRIGDELDLVDSRGSRRRWTVVEVGPARCSATTLQTAYIETGSKLTCRNEDATVIGALPNREQEHRIACAGSAPGTARRRHGVLPTRHGRRDDPRARHGQPPRWMAGSATGSGFWELTAPFLDH